MSGGINAQSTLFFSAVSGQRLSDIAACVVEDLRQGGVSVPPPTVTHQTATLFVHGIELILRQEARPIDLGPYMLAGTLQTEFGLPPAVQRDLAAHCDALVIEARAPHADPYHAPQSHLCLALCFVAALHAVGQTNPMLIHWRNREMFLTPDEFVSNAMPGSANGQVLRAAKEALSLAASHPMPPAPPPLRTGGNHRFGAGFRNGGLGLTLGFAIGFVILHIKNTLGIS